MSSPAPAAPSAPDTPAAPSAAPSRRKPALLLLTGALLLAAAGATGWWWLTERDLERTDNAYVQAPLVQVTPQAAGTVLAVLVDDTDRVVAGQPLVRLDPADARLALARAEAQLAQTVREVRTLYTQHATLNAGIHQREAELLRAQAELARAQDDVARRRPLLASGAVGGEEMKHAEATLAGARGTLASAQSALAAAQEQAVTQRVLTDGTRVEQHPTVERAAAAVREAFLALQRTELPAPVAGQVARRTVQVGQRLAAGTPLMSLVPLDQAWVEANFKEVQLRRMRVGQPVTLRADLYGSRVEFRGRVAGLGAGTGAAFALLPAQNATGNWIKVVQRVPVRVEIDPRDLAAHPLRVGLSMHATVDVGGAAGAPVAASPASAAAPRASSRTTVFQPASDDADRRVQAIIASQLGRAPRSRAALAP
jgi:membrane fusion protein (multidrug efflux system)